MKEGSSKLITILIVLAIIGYIVCLYPFIVSTDQEGNTKCESLIGIKVGC